ncbi:MAG: sugar nucleotide-binding protein [Pseudohongiellaceae bacterium]
MKLLVVGAESAVGRELVSQSQQRGIEVIAPPFRDLDSHDSLDVARIVTRSEPDQVLNLASFAAGSQQAPLLAEQHGMECEKLHLELPYALAQICDHLHVPLLQLSTALVFSGSKKLPYGEQDRPDPAGVYGRTALAGEQAVAATVSRHVIVRSGWLFGAGQDDQLKSWLKEVRETDGTLRAVRRKFNPTPVEDLARVLLAITQQVDCDAGVWGTYHYGSVDGRSESEFIREFIRIAARFDESIYALLDHLSVTPVRAEAPEVSNTLLASKKIFDTFGIKQRSWHGNLENLVKSHFSRKTAVS